LSFFRSNPQIACGTPTDGPSRTGRRTLLALSAAVVALGASSSSALAATQLYPDLKTLPPRELKLDYTDVSADSTGVMHNVLRFSNTVWNAGQGKLVVRGTIDPSTGNGPAYQRVYDDAGGYQDYPVGSFTYHAVHHHYHFDNWGRYELWTKAGYDAWVASGRSTGQAKVVGTKTTSCVLDEEFVKEIGSAPAFGQFPTSGCQPDANNVMLEGLSPGWGDTYDYYRFEQWVDFGTTKLADGDYVLRSVTDPLNKIYESPGKSDTARESADDNEAATPLTIRNGALVDQGPPSGTVQINDVDTQTSTPSVTVKVLGRDDVSLSDQVRLSNDGVTWATYNYTGSGSDRQSIPWNLNDSRYGGTSGSGVKTVFAQFHDRAGNWGPTTTDTIKYAVCAPATGSSSYASTVLADGPVSYWRLGEACGSTATDEQHVNNGTYVNNPSLGDPSLLGAEPGNPAVAFGGQGGQVRIPYSATLGLTAPMSLEAWIRPVTLPAAGSFASILTKPEAYSLQFNGPRLEFTVVQGGNRRRLQAPAGAVVAGRTYHVVGAYDGVAQRLYLNGTQVATVPLTGPSSTSTSDLFLASWDGASEFFNGTIDEAAIYDKALSAAQAQKHHDVGDPGATVPAPSNLTATAASSSRINVSWTDNSSNGNGFILERSTSPAFSATTSITIPQPGATSYADTGLAAGTTYYYRIKATNPTNSSGYSATASATTQAGAPAPPTYASTVLSDGPISYWRLGERSGTAAVDQRGANPGTYRNSPVLGDPSLLASDPADTAVRLGGTGGNVAVADSNSLDLTSAITLEAWMKPASLPAAGSFASVLSKPEAYSLQFNGPLMEFTVMQAGVRRRLQAPAGAVVAGRAYHVVGTYDGVTQRLYLNGVLVASRAQTGPATVTTTGLSIGSWSGYDEYFTGTIDEAAVYGKVLTAAQVQAHSTAGTPGQSTAATASLSRAAASKPRVSVRRHARPKHHRVRKHRRAHKRRSAQKHRSAKKHRAAHRRSR
jgi:hypothetical protein